LIGAGVVVAVGAGDVPRMLPLITSIKMVRLATAALRPPAASSSQATTSPEEVAPLSSRGTVTATAAVPTFDKVKLAAHPSKVPDMLLLELTAEVDEAIAQGQAHPGTCERGESSAVLAPRAKIAQRPWSMHCLKQFEVRRQPLSPVSEVAARIAEQSEVLRGGRWIVSCCRLPHWGMGAGAEEDEDEDDEDEELLLLELLDEELLEDELELLLLEDEELLLLELLDEEENDDDDDDEEEDELEPTLAGAYICRNLPVILYLNEQGFHCWISLVVEWWGGGI